MYFKKLEMHGFKSFAEPVVIEFNQGITCIVGPNGSGKSNISDAIRWVLGEQSPKMLRGGKMEEVIFAGTSSRKSRGMAEVTLVIDNEDGSLPIDYKEVAITRRMFRSGESEYHINGNQCRLRDIRELIMDTGIGVDGYSIIGQGKISDILSSRTESRREIFEEAAGIVLYRTKKAEAERKLAATNANMDRVRDIIGEIEGRIDGLREDSAKAQEYIRLRDRYKKLEINITLQNIESLEHKQEYLKDDLNELNTEIGNESSRKEELENNLQTFSSRSDELESSVAMSREKLMKAVEELNAAVKKNEVGRERLGAVVRDIERLKAELLLLEEKQEKENQEAVQCRQRKAELDRRLEDAQNNLREKIDVSSSIADEMTAVSEKIDKCKNEIFDATNVITSGKAEISSLERLQDTLDKMRIAILEEKNSGDDDNKDALDRLNSIKREKENAEEALESIREEIRIKREKSVRKQE